MFSNSFKVARDALQYSVLNLYGFHPFIIWLGKIDSPEVLLEQQCG